MNIFKLFLIILSIIILLNLSFWGLVYLNASPFSDIYDNGLIIKVKPYAFAFVHGDLKYHAGYEYINNTRIFTKLDNYHATKLDGQWIPTYTFTTQLYEQGYTYIWGTWCYSGNSDYLYEDNYLKLEWQDYVSRNKQPGMTVPIFLGLGFYRLGV